MFVNREKPQILYDLETEVQKSSLKFLYFGSYALKLMYADKLEGFQPPDIDLLVHGKRKSLLSLSHSLTQKKWELLNLDPKKGGNLFFDQSRFKISPLFTGPRLKFPPFL